MSAPTEDRISDPAGKVLADPQAFTDETSLHQALAHLRKTAPVSWVDFGDYRPFWAITKHADIMDIERQNDLFTNDPRPFLDIAEFDEKQRAEREAGIGLRTLIHMDDPHHRDVRKIGADSHDELVSVEPGNDSPVRHLHRQTSSYHSQHFVTRGITQRVVEYTEVIEFEEDHRDRQGARINTRLQLLKQCTATDESSQLVMSGQRQFRIGILMLHAQSPVTAPGRNRGRASTC